MAPVDTTSDAFDLIVLGAGSGGLSGAKRAALRGARVLVVETSRVGGTCVLRGCIPKKLMVYASQLGESRGLSEAYGWPEAEGPHDWAALCRARDAVLDRLEAMHRSQLDKADITLVQGEAHFVDAHTVAVGQTHYKARHVLIATGSAPVMPKVSGIEHCLDSDAFFELAELPASAVLVGGGYIAVEFAGLLQSLGCQVHLVVRSQVLRVFDEAISVHVRDGMRKQGVHIYEQTDVKGIHRDASGKLEVWVEGDDGAKRLEAERCVLFAAGRAPQTKALNCEAAGVTLKQHGAVAVDKQHQTSTAHIFAVGDVIDRVNLTPVAIKAARSVAEQLFGKGAAAVSYDNIPTAVFSHPPVGTVGLTQAEAEAQDDVQVRVYESRFVPLLYAVQPQERKVQTLMKLVVDEKTDKVLGFHMVGDDAPEIIQGFAAAMQAGITKTQLDSTTALHPSAAEEFVLMR